MDSSIEEIQRGSLVVGVSEARSRKADPPPQPRCLQPSLLHNPTSKAEREKSSLCASTPSLFSASQHQILQPRSTQFLLSRAESLY